MCYPNCATTTTSLLSGMLLCGSLLWAAGCGGEPRQESPDPAAGQSTRADGAKAPRKDGAVGDRRERTEVAGPVAESPRPPAAEAGVALCQAAAEGYLDDVRAALEKGAQVDARDDNGCTALMLAAFDGHEAVVRFLLERGADVNATNRGGQTTLMAAASGAAPGTVKLLLESGASVNTREKTEMYTALMFAASEGLLDNVRLLLQHGADKTLVDVDGETAADFARRNNHPDVVELLEQ